MTFLSSLDNRSNHELTNKKCNSCPWKRQQEQTKYSPLCGCDGLRGGYLVPANWIARRLVLFRTPDRTMNLPPPLGFINVIDSQGNKLKARVIIQLYSHIGAGVISATATHGGRQTGDTMASSVMVNILLENLLESRGRPKNLFSLAILRLEEGSFLAEKNQCRKGRR
eukprot:CAMPEP_0201870226 /NCGR_PEP_ID=MMETSP0902-20130614/3408_1 /ASSEMBLY_ACC=CAM_ASM_000551 /TAXON_ID=420261 /ORGANISM="Thalassiosira antarctica, Strain CCMP982" /LENGTH=167 /DNA_ID=CAMNT_0048395811 /DNA_START=644 /DNA_END=1148 /DNA_ORIENTATION=-